MTGLCADRDMYPAKTSLAAAPTGGSCYCAHCDAVQSMAQSHRGCTFCLIWRWHCSLCMCAGFTHSSSCTGKIHLPRLHITPHSDTIHTLGPCSLHCSMDLMGWPMQGGCIIRAVFLDDIYQAYKRNPALENLMMDEEFADPSWSTARRHGEAWSSKVTPAQKSSFCSNHACMHHFTSKFNLSCRSLAVSAR